MKRNLGIDERADFVENPFDGRIDGEVGNGPDNSLDDSVSGFSESAPSLASTSFADIADMKSSSHGFSRLMRAKLHGKWVVLKTLKPQYADNPELQNLLRKEFEIGYSLNHPNIAQTLDFVEVPGYGSCIVMEWVDGRSLKQLIHDRQLDAESAVAVLKDVVHALDYIHRRQIVHRDVKPSNIMVTSIGNVPKLIDFGLSDGSAFHILKHPAGTPRYMSPEATDGTNLDERIDIYSVGIIADEINHSLAKSSATLRRVARQCADPDPARRPRTFRDIRWKASASWRLIVAAVVAAIVVAAICVVRIILLRQRQPSPAERDNIPTVSAVTVEEKRDDGDIPAREEKAVSPGPRIVATAPAVANTTADKEELAAAERLKEERLHEAKRLLKLKMEEQAEIRAEIERMARNELDATHKRALQLKQQRGTPLTNDDVAVLLKDNDIRLEQRVFDYFEANPEKFERAGYTRHSAKNLLEQVKVNIKPANPAAWTALTR